MKTRATMKKTTAMPVFSVCDCMVTAISVASRPKSVVNLMTGFMETEEVSLNGSPTVSPTTVASWSGRVLLFQVDLDDLLRIVPCAAGVGHEDRLEETEEGDADQVADEEVGVEERQGQGHEEDDDEDVDHALLRILGADLHDFLAVLDGSRLAVELDVLLDVDDRPVGAGDDGLGGRAGEPVDHRAAHEEAEDDLRLHEAELRDDAAEHPFQQDDDAEDHGGGADDGRADEHRLCRGLEGVARAVCLFEVVLAVLEVGIEAELLLDLRLDVGDALDLGELVDGLRVVGDRTEAVDRNGHRTHAEETEGHEAEGEDRRCKGELLRHEGLDRRRSWRRDRR